MKLYVSEISEEQGLRVHESYDEGEPRLRSRDTEIIGRPSLDLKANRAGSELKLTGTITATVRIDCARCLKSIPVLVDEHLDLCYLPAPDVIKPDEERELGEEDLSIGFYRDDCVDLDDVVREQIELALPMARLCTEECRGLCPHCGANLNETQCGCGNDEVDPRWAALGRWKTEKE